ncbi:hypothetical protein [Neptunomonas sp.]|uniref:hypothetical protein n=1 Tax=Neptunomonas TaxID=75687 RepID=UPI0035115E83
MLWMIPVGIGVGVGIKLLYDAVTEEEKEARVRWEEKREQVEKSIEEHQRNIDNHIQEASSSYDFHFLVDLHYSSMKVADVAYKLLDDARLSLNGMNRMLREAKKQKLALESELIIAKKEKNREAKSNIIEQLKVVNEIRRSLFDDRDKVSEQKDTFLSEVKRLNNQTRDLKIHVKDRCGSKGLDWFNRGEERKRSRRLMEGKVI